MAILQASGIQFSDGSILNSLYGIVPQDKRMIFYQAAAPTGWTKLTQLSEPGDLDGSAIQVTAGSGGNLVNVGPGFISPIPLDTRFGPSPISFNPNGPFTTAGSIDNTTLTTQTLAQHSHGAGSSFNAESGPPAPTSYQSPATAFYNERININIQNSYRQPRQTRDQSTYRQPSAYRQPANRRALTNNQLSRSVRNFFDRRATIQVQNPRSSREAVQAVVNAQVLYPQSRRQPNTTNVPRETRVQQNQPNPVTRRQNRGVRNQGNRRSDNPANRRRPNSFNRRSPNSFNRRSPRGGNRRTGRRRRSPRSFSRRRPSGGNRRRPNGGTRRSPSTTQTGRSPRTTGQNPQSRRADLQFQRTPRVQSPVNRRDPVNRRQDRREVIRFPISFRSEVQAAKLYRRPTNAQEVTVYQQPTVLRNPFTSQTPNITRVTKNTRVNANKRVVGNRRRPARTPTTSQNPVVNSSNYPQPSIVPGGEVRGVNANAPDGETIGGNQSHNHPFVGSTFDVTAPSGFKLQLQYIDVIICSFD